MKLILIENRINYFLISSYGNLTASNLKYKTFVNREELSEVLRSASSAHHHAHVPSSAAALYSSQTSSRSSSPISNTNKNHHHNKYVYTYYLNALIESEKDEGVYQCINPDSPNYVLRNVTVLIEREILII